MDPQALVFIAPALFGTAFVIAAAGGVWVTARFLRKRERSSEDLRRAIDHLAEEMGELNERVDLHERMLQQYREAARLERGR